MGNKGWICLHRKIMDDDLWISEPFTRGQAWVDLLLLANHKPGTIRRRGIAFIVNRGQVGYGEESLARRWKWSRGKVRRFLEELRKRHQISKVTLGRLCVDSDSTTEKVVQKNISVSSCIEIVNYSRYQVHDTENDTEDRQKTDGRRYRNNNDNNENNDNKKEERVEKPVALPPCPHQKIVLIFHENCPGLPRVIKLTDKRTSRLQSCWKDKGRQSMEWWAMYFQRVRGSPFLNGENDRGWKADFEWLTNESNLVKVLEGKYDGNGNGSRNAGRGASPAIGFAGNAKSDDSPWPEPRVYGPE